MKAPSFWNIKEGRDAAFVLRTLLVPFSWAYDYFTQKKLHETKPVKLTIPVISIGNLTLGGTGKTPMADLLASTLDGAYIVSRGYGGNIKDAIIVNPQIHTAQDVGDEPLMLAATHNVAIGHDRVAAANLAVQNGAKAIILDDAHQNPAIKKDVSIVLIDGGVGFGNGFICPAGPLRERPEIGLKRADIVVWVGDKTLFEETLGKFNIKTIFAKIIPVTKQFSGKYLAFCGIGRPDKFGASLKELGVDVVDLIPFADHHFYTDDEMTHLKARAKELDAKLITTQKDIIRLTPSQKMDIETLEIKLEFENDGDVSEILNLLPKV